MKVSAMNCHYRFYTLEDFFKNAKKNGFHYVELWTGPMHYYLDYQQYSDVQILKDLEKKYGVKVIGICPEQTNPKPNNMAMKDLDGQVRVYNYFKNAIDVASQIKANHVVVTSGWAYLSEDKEQALNRSANMMRKLADYAKKKNIMLAIEALQPREYIQRRGRILRLAPGKERAVIYDFVTLPIPADELEGTEESVKIYKSLVKNETARMEEFGAHSLNRGKSDTLVEQIKNDYGLYEFENYEPNIEWGDDD